MVSTTVKYRDILDNFRAHGGLFPGSENGLVIRRSYTLVSKIDNGSRVTPYSAEVINCFITSQQS